MRTPEFIPFNRPCLTGNEVLYMGEAVAKGQIAGDGPFTARCRALLEELLGAPQVLLTTSCTHALEMAALLLDLAPGDEVICPTFTFVSTANAFALRGAKVVFADSRPDTLNIDERQIESLITPRTRAIVPVHYAGVGCAMDDITAIAARHGLDVVEDAAQALFARYRGRPLGAIGQLATFSFHETKNVTCGEGGALAINDPRFAARAEIIRQKGTNRSAFFRGQVDKYTWVDLGSSYVLSDLNAAFLLAQLESRALIQERRRAIWTYYATHLADWANAHGVRVPVVPDDCEQPYHMFYLLMPSLDERQRLIARLRARDILAVFHFVPLHLSTMGARMGYDGKGALPVAEDASDRLVRLPFYNDLSEAELERIVEAVTART